MASTQKDSRFYVPSKTIHNQAKYVVMDNHDQEASQTYQLLFLYISWDKYHHTSILLMIVLSSKRPL